MSVDMQPEPELLGVDGETSAQYDSFFGTLLPGPHRRRPDVYGLQMNNVIEPHEYAMVFPDLIADPSLIRRNVFAYMDTRDLCREGATRPGGRRARV